MNMAQQYRKWYSCAMSYYDDIYEHAVDNYYLIFLERRPEAPNFPRMSPCPGTALLTAVFVSNQYFVNSG